MIKNEHLWVYTKFMRLHIPISLQKFFYLILFSSFYIGFENNFVLVLALISLFDFDDLFQQLGIQSNLEFNFGDLGEQYVCLIW